MVPYLFAPGKAADIVSYLWPKFTFYAQNSTESYQVHRPSLPHASSARDTLHIEGMP